MRNAQESYLSDEEEERKTAASAEQNRKHASGGPQKVSGRVVTICQLHNQILQAICRESCLHGVCMLHLLPAGLLHR